MYDITLRPLKDLLFDPLADAVPYSIGPGHITLLAFVSGIVSCLAIASSNTSSGFLFWTLNRVLDSLDGAVARKRQQASDLGGFLDLLGDFIVYSLIPIACAWPTETSKTWIAVAAVEASFHVNNFVLFYIAAILEKRKGASDGDDKAVKELTSVSMRPAMIEGAESGLLFTVMIASSPRYTALLCWIMAALVSLSIFQRVLWIWPVLA